jgi:hemoglobin
MSDLDVPTGAQSVTHGTDLFVARLLNDPHLGWAFEGVDYDRVLHHARAFVIAALGGPDLYMGRGLRSVHQRFQLNNTHFDAAVIHLVDSMREAGIAEGVVAELPQRIEPLRSQIVSPSASQSR